jgi:hypothetical protein
MEKLKSETIQVNSKAIKKARYNYDNSILKLTFVNGKKYNYHNVPIDKFISMKYSESIGRFINKNIIKNFNFTK